MSTPTTTPPANPLPSPRRSECRVRARHTCDLQASCQPVAARHDDEPHWPGIIRDLSTRGVSLVLERRFERGAGLAIELPASGDRPEETLLARVVHTTWQPDGHWVHGCLFISELSEDEVQDLLGLGKAQRAAAQQEPADAETTAVPRVTFRGQATDGQRVKFSAGVAHTQSAWPPAAGARLAVRVGSKTSVPAEVRLLVEGVEARNGGWLVHCRFTGGSRAAVLRSLRRAASPA